jgi:peroxiredoxin
VYHSFADDEHSYVPYTEEKGDITSCGIPQNYNASKEFANKKVVLFAVPGTCWLSVLSLPPHLLLSGRT